MKISDVMTPNPKTVSMGDDLQKAAAIMRDEDAGSVPVVEEGRIVGIVTDRDCAIEDVCSDDVVCARPDMSTSEAAELMGEHQIRRLPVVDDDDRLVGIVSLGDIAVKEGRDSKMGDTLEDISEGVKRH